MAGSTRRYLEDIRFLRIETTMVMSRVSGRGREKWKLLCNGF